MLVPFNCRLPADIRRALKRHAAEHGTRIQDIVAAAPRAYLREHLTVGKKARKHATTDEAAALPGAPTGVDGDGDHGTSRRKERPVMADTTTNPNTATSTAAGVVRSNASTRTPCSSTPMAGAGQGLPRLDRRRRRVGADRRRPRPARPVQR